MEEENIDRMALVYFFLRGLHAVKFKNAHDKSFSKKNKKVTQLEQRAWQEMVRVLNGVTYTRKTTWLLSIVELALLANVKEDEFLRTLESKILNGAHFGYLLDVFAIVEPATKSEHFSEHFHEAMFDKCLSFID